MPPVVAVLWLVVCDPGLILCEPVEVWHSAWENVEFCDRAKGPIVARMQARIGVESLLLY